MGQSGWVDGSVFALKIAMAEAMKEVFESVVLGKGARGRWPGGGGGGGGGGRKVSSLFRRRMGFTFVLKLLSWSVCVSINSVSVRDRKLLRVKQNILKRLLTCENNN